MNGRVHKQYKFNLSVTPLYTFVPTLNYSLERVRLSTHLHVVGTEARELIVSD